MIFFHGYNYPSVKKLVEPITDLVKEMQYGGIMRTG